MKMNFLKNTVKLASVLCILFLIFQCRAQDESADIGMEDFESFRPVPQSDIDERVQTTNRLYESRTNAITRAVERISPAIVGINVTQIRRVTQRSFFENDPLWWYFYQPRESYRKVESLGSGFLISSDGYILTNQHVVSQAVEIIVTMTDGKHYKAEKIGEDATYDVAVLKIDGENLPFISLGNSEEIIIGEWVIAFGNPFGLFDVNSKPTVTVGVISATDLDFKRVNNRSYNDMIQTDAAINSGNSGGPLVNSAGECVGINTFIFSGNNAGGTNIGIGFAIPINRVKSILPELKTVGHLDRSFQTGIAVEDLDWVTARVLGISPYDGVIVTKVDHNSTADKAGVQKGDVIVAINDQRIRSTNQAQKIINQIDILEEKQLKLTLFRKGKLFNKVVNL